MQTTAKLKYLLMSPRKLRRVVDLIKGKSVEEALSILKFTNKAAAVPLTKTIQSATANALAEEGTSRLKAEDLSISKICIDEGPRMKRIEFRAMGRANRIVRRFSHVTVVLEGAPQEEAAPKKKARGRKKTADKARELTAGDKKTAKTKSTARKSTRKTTAKKTTARAKKVTKGTARKATVSKGTAEKKKTAKTAKKKKESI